MSLPYLQQNIFVQFSNSMKNNSRKAILIANKGISFSLKMYVTHLHVKFFNLMLLEICTFFSFPIKTESKIQDVRSYLVTHYF